MKKLLLMGVYLCSIPLLGSCGLSGSSDTILSPQGCLLQRGIDDIGGKYYYGICINKSIVVQWTQKDESEVSVIRDRNKKIHVFVRPKGGEWVEIEDTMQVPNFPPGVEFDALPIG